MQDAEALMSPALRKPTDDEKREIFDVLKSTAAHLPAEYELRIHELRYKEAFVFVREDILRLAELISKRKNIYFAGIFAGSFRKSKFKVSLDLAEHLYRLGCWNNQVVLEPHGSKSFLYGRNVEKEFVHGTGKGVVLVLNLENDVIGLGFMSEDSDKLINLVDKGWYLRKGH
jgi:ribosome biogenesis protein Nip4